MLHFFTLLFLVEVIYAETDDVNLVTGCAHDEKRVLPFSYMVYNQLASFDQIEKENRGKGEDAEIFMKPMLKLFRKHEMEKYTGVNVLHNHVTIQRDEIMLEVPVQNAENTSLIFVMGPMKEAQIQNADKVPYLFKLDVATRKWIPLEFTMKNEIITDSYTKFVTNHKFQEELVDLIVKLGTSDKFGITLKRRTQTNVVEESGFNGRMHYIFEILPGTSRETQYQVGYWSNAKIGKEDCDHCNHCDHCRRYWSHHKTGEGSAIQFEDCSHCNHCDHCRRYWSCHKTDTNSTDPMIASRALPEEECGFLEVIDKTLADFLYSYMSISS